MMGILGGLLNRAPCVRFIPRITLYKRLDGILSGSKPWVSAVNLIAAMWALMFLCEWVGQRWVAKRIRVSCVIGNIGILISWQNNV